MKGDQWEKFSPKFTAMIGNFDDRPSKKLWRDIKKKKIEDVVKRRATDMRWEFQIQNRYEQAMQNRIDQWEEVEIKYIEKFCKLVIDNVKFYQTSTLNILKVELQFPTGFVCQPIVEKQIKDVNGAKKTKLEIYENMIEVLNRDKNDFVKKRDIAWAVLKDPESDDKRILQNFENLKECVAKFF